MYKDHMKVKKDAVCDRCATAIEVITHLFHTCEHFKNLWATATHYINTIIGTDQLTWTSFKWIVLGFHNAPIHKHLIPALEDIRLAYFHTIWFTRDQALWYLTYPKATIIFHNKLTEYITHRHREASTQQHLKIFTSSYGRIYNAGKLRKPATHDSKPTPYTHSPTHTSIITHTGTPTHCVSEV